MTIESAGSQAARYQQLVQNASDIYDSMQKVADANLRIFSLTIDAQRSSLEILKAVVSSAADGNPIFDMASENMRRTLAAMANWQPK